MRPILLSLVAFSIFFGGSYYGSTTAPVVLSGAIIKSSHTDMVKKYKRSECPICKGKGWYVSGDGIAKIKCEYCEPGKGQTPQQNDQTPTNRPKLKIIHR